MRNLAVWLGMAALLLRTVRSRQDNVEMIGEVGVGQTKDEGYTAVGR